MNPDPDPNRRMVGTLTKRAAEEYKAKMPQKSNFTFEVTGYRAGVNTGMRSPLAQTYIIIPAVDSHVARMMLEEMMPNLMFEFRSQRMQ